MSLANTLLMISPRLSRLYFVLNLAVVATVLALVGQNLLLPLRFRFYDAGLSNRAWHKPPDIVILGIDERFMVGRHAYLAPRDRLATLIDNLSAAKPKAIALDVWLDSRVDDRQNGDARLQRALQNSRKRGVPVVLSDLPPAQTEWGLNASNGQTARGGVIPYFARQARTGNVLFAPDEDGAIRWHLAEIPKPSAPSAQASGAGTSGAGTTSAGTSGVEASGVQKSRAGDFGSFSLPFQMARLSGAKIQPRFQETPLDFCGPPGTIETQSAADFLQPELAPLLEGKLIFIGATYPRSLDFHRTPFSIDQRNRPMYGVELLAQATDSLRRPIPSRSDRSGAARAFSFCLIFLVCLGLSIAALRSNAAGLALAGFALLASVGAAVCSAQFGGPWWGFRFHDAAPFLLAAPVALLGGIGRRSWTTARELRRVRETFGAYVGDEILQSLGGKMPELGGETRQIAVLFCDIRGYSALAESMEDDPRALLDELNAHFAPLVGALKKRGAYVDNYVGDLIMALFGAPISSGDFPGDVRSATLAALDFVQLIESRNRERRERGQIPIEVGIGVHCGLAVVGNVGSRDQGGGKIHYTAIGDVVNVASRVESATRNQNVALLVTREVVEVIGESPNWPVWERIGEILVKGRQSPVEIFKIG